MKCLLAGWAASVFLALCLYSTFVSIPIVAYSISFVIFMYTVFIRPITLCWGATEAEMEDSAHTRSNQNLQCIHAIEINKPAQEIWPWLVQIGYGRAGLYSYRFLDNWLANKAQRYKLVPEWQRIQVGDILTIVPGLVSMRVEDVCRPNKLRLGNVTVSVEGIDVRRSRVIIHTRGKYRYDFGVVINFIVWHFLWEGAKFLLERKCLLNLKKLVESSEGTFDPDKLPATN